MVSEEFLHLRVESHEAARGPCRATVRLHPLGAMIAAKVECAGLRVHRDLDAIAQDRSEVFFAILHLAGDQSTIRQGEEWRPLTPGSIAFIDPNRPFAVSLPGPFRYLVIAIPAQALESRGPDLHHRGGAVVTAAHPMARLAGSTIRDVLALDPSLREERSAGLGCAIVELLALVFAGSRPAPCAADRHWNEACTHIDLYLADPDLSPAAIARALGISVRYLHQIFARHTTTVGRFVRERRLERCAADLLAFPDRKVAGVSLAWGFNDPAHFSRCFRETFRMSPSEWRQEAPNRRRHGFRRTGDLEPAGRGGEKRQPRPAALAKPTLESHYPGAAKPGLGGGVGARPS